MRFQQIELGSRRHESLAGVEHLRAVSGVRGDDRYTDHGPTVQILEPNLGNRYFVLPTKVGDHGADEAALFLQRVNIAKEDVELECSYEHDVLPVSDVQVRREASRDSRTSR